MGKYEDFLEEEHYKLIDRVTALWHENKPEDFIHELSKDTRFAVCYRYNDDPKAQGLGHFILVDVNGQSCPIASMLKDVSQEEADAQLFELRDDLPREKDVLEMINAVKAYQDRWAIPSSKLPDETEDDYKIATYYDPCFYQIVRACNVYVREYKNGGFEFAKPPLVVKKPEIARLHGMT